MRKFFLRLTTAGMLVVGIFPAGQTFAQEQPTLADLSWVLGTWQRETAKSTTYETWRKLSDRTYEGESFRVSKATKDTVFAESLLLVEMAGEIFYIPKVPENKYPVPFKLVSFAGNKAVFENIEHDFPQRITYVQKAENAMTVFVSGKINGQERQIVFEFMKL